MKIMIDFSLTIVPSLHVVIASFFFFFYICNLVFLRIIYNWEFFYPAYWTTLTFCLTTATYQAITTLLSGNYKLFAQNCDFSSHKCKLTLHKSVFYLVS